jgi:threonine aldolase
LLGSEEFIREARRVRKLYGGGMRQSGYLAAAGIYALENNIDRLKDDHLRARELAQILSGLSYVTEIMPVDTNIVIFRLSPDFTEKEYLNKLKNKGILAIGFGPQTVRMVTHLDFSGKMMDQAKNILKEF